MPTSATRKAMPGKTVLIVDDSASIRNRIRELFLSEGYELCAEASNGKQALEVAEHCDPDLIVLDLAMPVMNGLEAAPKLKQIVPDASIILFTLHASTIRAAEFTDIGIAAVVAKTDPLECLLETANGFLQHQPLE